ncbi:MAG: MEDS domain-containing protein [Nitrospinae bacterium]|nr:MEDS domain-containing protein [Nitrospinota bacterium]
MKKPAMHGLSLVEAIERLEIHDHLCLIYEGREEQFAAIVPFFKAGLARREKCVYIADENTSQGVLDTLRREIMDVDSALASGALSVITKRDAYLKQGYFEPDSMIRLLKETVESAKEQGFSGLRVTGEMTWALGDEPGVEGLVEYEAKLNYFLPQNDILVICQYSAKRFSPEILIDIIRTHPIVIYGNTVCENFYYVPPDEFLVANQPGVEARRLLKNILDREQAEVELRKAYDELRDKADRLELFHEVTVGRELEMVRLKKEVNALLAELGRPGKYE